MRISTAGGMFFAGAVSAIGRAILKVVSGSATLRIHLGVKQCVFEVHFASRLVLTIGGGGGVVNCSSLEAVVVPPPLLATTR